MLHQKHSNRGVTWLCQSIQKYNKVFWLCLETRTKKRGQISSHLWHMKRQLVYKSCQLEYCNGSIVSWLPHFCFVWKPEQKKMCSKMLWSMAQQKAFENHKQSFVLQVSPAWMLKWLNCLMQTICLMYLCVCVCVHFDQQSCCFCMQLNLSWIYSIWIENNCSRRNRGLWPTTLFQDKWKMYNVILQLQHIKTKAESSCLL